VPAQEESCEGISLVKFSRPGVALACGVVPVLVLPRFDGQGAMPPAPCCNRPLLPLLLASQLLGVAAGKGYRRLEAPHPWLAVEGIGSIIPFGTTSGQGIGCIIPFWHYLWAMSAIFISYINRHEDGQRWEPHLVE